MLEMKNRIVILKVKLFKKYMYSINIALLNGKFYRKCYV